MLRRTPSRNGGANVFGWVRYVVTMLMARYRPEAIRQQGASLGQANCRFDLCESYPIAALALRVRHGPSIFNSPQPDHA
jgi:hypothetical protein